MTLTSPKFGAFVVGPADGLFFMSATLPALLCLLFGAASFFDGSRFSQAMFITISVMGAVVVAFNLIERSTAAFLSAEIGVSLAILLMITIVNGFRPRLEADPHSREPRLCNSMSAP